MTPEQNLRMSLLPVGSWLDKDDAEPTGVSACLNGSMLIYSNTFRRQMETVDEQTTMD